MKHLKNFKQYETDEHPILGNVTGSALLLKCDTGEDWYCCQCDFEPSSMKIVYDSRGVVVDYNTDVSKLVPWNCSVIEILMDDVPEDTELRSAYVISGDKLQKRKHSIDELKAIFEKNKQIRVDNAQQVIKTIELMRKHDMGHIDESLVTEWEKYFISLVMMTYQKGVKFADEPKKPF